MNLTIELLNTIGSPFVPSIEAVPHPIKTLELYNYSIKNRICLLYLEALKIKGKLNNLKSYYEIESKKYLKTLNAITRVSQLLTNGNIQHAIYKTIRPYKATTVDIDVLIFEPKRRYEKAIKSLQEAGYKLKERGPESITLQDPKVDIGVDLYEEVAISHIIYLDKQKMYTYVTTTELPNGKHVKTLKPEADLATVIAHSVIKEHIYLLSEYYTFLYHLSQMNVQNFIKIVKENNITSATRTHATITAILHEVVHGRIPSELQEILNQLGDKTLEIDLLIKNDFKMPQKYHPFTVARSLLEKMEEKKSKRSMATQLLHMLNPKFTKGVVKGFIDHITRETY